MIGIFQLKITFVTDFWNPTIALCGSSLSIYTILILCSPLGGLKEISSGVIVSTNKIGGNNRIVIEMRVRNASSSSVSIFSSLSWRQLFYIYFVQHTKSDPRSFTVAEFLHNFVIVTFFTFWDRSLSIMFPGLVLVWKDQMKLLRTSTKKIPLAITTVPGIVNPDLLFRFKSSFTNVRK